MLKISNIIHLLELKKSDFNNRDIIMADNIKEIQRAVNFNTLLDSVKKDEKYRNKKDLFPILIELFENIFNKWNWGTNYTDRRNKLYTFLLEEFQIIKISEENNNEES